MAVVRRAFLPVSLCDLRVRGWDCCDFILITGDAYVDHASFGTAVIGRWLESLGFRVGVIAQPDYRDVEAFRVLGAPRLGFLINGGNLDSMVANYTVNRRLRHEDFYSPGGVSGKRPDRAVIVYSSMAKGAYKGVPVIIGGLEASLRRLPHYDFWSDKVRRSILLDSKADVLIYGMGELAVGEIARRLDSGVGIRDILDVRGTVVRCKGVDLPLDVLFLPSFEEVVASKVCYAASFRVQIENTDPICGKSLAHPLGGVNSTSFLLQNLPQPPLSQGMLDAVYDLPFTREWHPDYSSVGGVPALKEVQFGLTSVRGCFGGCSFCAISFHQGGQIVSRSHESVLKEARAMVGHPDFRGTINDVGGPTANFRRGSCSKQEEKGTCKDRSCLGFDGCKNLKADHSDYLALLRKLRNLPGVKHLFIRSGIRFDYLLRDPDDSFFRELVRYHVSGQLKVAPEHACDRVLRVMNKPPIGVYESFREKFFGLTNELGKKQFVIPYLMSSHPGSDLGAAVELALFLKRTGFIPDQVQDFYPTPGTLSTAIFYCGFHPVTGEEIFSAKNERDKKKQRALLHFHKPENWVLVREALIEAGRQDLIGRGPLCLIGNLGSGSRVSRSGQKKRRY